MAVISTICITLFFVAIVALFRKVLITSSWYKSVFAKIETQFAGTTKNVFAPLKEKTFADLNKHLKTVNGDVLEIGVGAGENFEYYPDGTALIAVDSNSHVEELLKASLEKVGDRIRLKKFVVASAEKLDVADNSVAAVVCTLVLCSIGNDQIRKTLKEVKRVLMPVSIVFSPMCKFMLGFPSITVKESLFTSDLFLITSGVFSVKK